MDWIKASVKTTKDGIDSVSGLLMEQGILGIEIADKDDFKDFLENNKKYWDYVDEELEKLKEAETSVTFYVEATPEGIELLNNIKGLLKDLKQSDNENLYGRLLVECDNVKDEDWSEIWKQYFHPIKVGKNILICPEWESAENSENRTVFRVNPGLTFGTGSHASTRFCLEAMEANIKNGDTVLDLGCGSGILSVTSLLLGAESAVGVDIDSNSKEAVSQNLHLNDLSEDKYTLYIGDIISDTKLRESLGKYDVVLANIVSDVIIAIAPYVRAFMKEDAVFICSGIINERLDEVKGELINNGFNVTDIKSDDDWSAITLK